MVKELKYNYKNAIESLNLCWASKASCEQRRGRAGRLRNGFVFRFVDERFYNKFFEDFSTPEILRCPLEKIILTIKVWGHDEPRSILSRAIDPPLLENINLAITNLLVNGALTLPDSKSASGHLTSLGRVFAELPLNIRFSRLIMLAYSINLTEVGIIIASILDSEKEKSIVRVKDNFINREFLRLITFGTESDLLGRYNLYKWWERKFPNENLRKNEFDIRYFKSNSEREEREWCKNHSLNFNVLRDVQKRVADLKSRLNRLGFYNSEEQIRFELFSSYKNNAELFRCYLESVKLKDNKKKQKSGEDRRYQQAYNETESSYLEKIIDFINYDPNQKDKLDDINLNNILGFDIDECLNNKEENTEQPSNEQVPKSAFDKEIKEEKNKYEKKKNEELDIMSINHQDLIDYSLINSCDESEVTLIKIIIGGAFNGKYLYSEYENIKLVREVQAPDFSHRNYSTIKLKTLPRWSNEKLLMKFFEDEMNIPVKEIKHYDDNADVLLLNTHSCFEDEKAFLLNLQNNISYILSTINSNSTRCLEKFFDKNKSSKYPFEEISKIKASHTHTIRHINFYEASEMLIGAQSINSAMVELSTKKIGDKTIICEDISYKKDKSSIVLKSTLIDNSSMGNLLLVLIFSPKVIFFPGKDNSSYGHFNIHESDKNFEFKHLFSGVDVEEINEVRELFNKIVTDKINLANKKDLKRLLMSKILQVWSKKRIKVINNSNWYKLFCKYYKKDNYCIDAFKKYFKTKNSSSYYTNTVLIKEEQLKDKDISEKQETTAESDAFLPALKTLDIKEDYRLWSSEGLSDLVKERTQFEELKVKIESTIKKNEDLCKLKNAQILCGVCDENITGMDNMKEMPNNEFINIIGYSFVNEVEVNSDKYFSLLKGSSAKDLADLMIKKYNINKLFTCRKGHLIGFVVESNRLIIKDSPLKVLFPTGVNEKFIFELGTMKAREKKYIDKRKELIKKIECEVCEIDFTSDVDYIKHLKANDHKENINDFLKESFV